jgi:putative endonuclease
MTVTPRRRLGDLGEAHARRHLEAKGYRFVAGAWRCAYGELDLIMLDADGTELVFVEVKTRHGEAAGRAEEAVGSAKARRLFAAAELFLAERPQFADRIWRVDLVAITLDRAGVVREVRHYVNAVYSG